MVWELSGDTRIVVAAGAPAPVRSAAAYLQRAVARRSGTQWQIVDSDPARFGDAAHYREMVADTAAAAHGVTPAPSVRAVLVPGELEARTLEQRARDGIVVPEATWVELAASAAEVGVPVPDIHRV